MIIIGKTRKPVTHGAPLPLTMPNPNHLEGDIT
jgi:hypothetical protein